MTFRTRFASLVLVGLLATGSAVAGRGAAELALDRPAVAGLIEAALPDPIVARFPSIGTLTLRVEAPSGLEFRDGGVEAELPLAVDELELRIELSVRFVPEIDPLDGTLRLVAESAVPAARLPFRFDFADWLGSVELPRRLDWGLALPSERHLDLTCFVQGVEIDDARLRVELAIVTRPADAP